MQTITSRLHSQRLFTRFTDHPIVRPSAVLSIGKIDFQHRGNSGTVAVQWQYSRRIPHRVKHDSIPIIRQDAFNRIVRR